MPQKLAATDRETARPADVPADSVMAASKGFQNLPRVLAQMGWKELRKGQDEVVKTIMTGFDTMAILPTSLGKTACFVVPTLCMGWKTLVIYPLLSLMRDQEQAMQRAGIAAAAISSDSSDAANRAALTDWVMGKLQFMRDGEGDPRGPGDSECAPGVLLPAAREPAPLLPGQLQHRPVRALGR